MREQPSGRYLIKTFLLRYLKKPYRGLVSSYSATLFRTSTIPPDPRCRSSTSSRLAYLRRNLRRQKRAQQLSQLFIEGGGFIKMAQGRTILLVQRRQPHGLPEAWDRLDHSVTWRVRFCYNKLRAGSVKATAGLLWRTMVQARWQHAQAFEAKRCRWERRF